MAGFCATCSKSQRDFRAEESKKRVEKRQSKCRHREERAVEDDYTGGLGYRVFACTSCGWRRREEIPWMSSKTTRAEARRHPAQGQMQAQEAIAAAMTEDELLENVKDAATKLGWLFYHTRDSRKSDIGFPDCAMVREERGGARRVFAELKRESGEESEPQLRWLNSLSTVGGDVEADTWRPSDWLDGTIEAVLR